jgi:hypothetical protein
VWRKRVRRKAMGTLSLTSRLLGSIAKNHYFVLPAFLTTRPDSQLHFPSWIWLATRKVKGHCYCELRPTFHLLIYTEALAVLKLNFKINDVSMHDAQETCGDF